MTEREPADTEPEAESPGISRGQDEPDDAERAGPSGTRAGPNSEYAADAEPGGPGPDDVEGGDGNRRPPTSTPTSRPARADLLLSTS